jgi:CRISPR/Cas system-associated exonuclease Cas4 (RecB family)
MTKNLLKEVMIKKEKKKKMTLDMPTFDVSGLVEKIQSGYLIGRESKYEKKKTFAPSTLAYGHGECARYWYLAFEGGMFEKTDTPYGVANMTSGTLSHDRIQDAMLKSGIAKPFLDEKETEKQGKEVYTTEFKVISSDPPIFGYGDAMITWNDEEVVGEIKTMPNDAFEYFKNANKPKKGHLIQLLIYMKVLKKKKGVLIYENKNNHELVLFPIEVNSHYIRWVDQTFDWMREVRKSWEDKQLPIKNYRSNSKICKSCPLQQACADAGTGVVKIKSLEPIEDEELQMV